MSDYGNFGRAGTGPLDAFTGHDRVGAPSDEDLAERRVAADVRTAHLGVLVAEGGLDALEADAQKAVNEALATLGSSDAFAERRYSSASDETRGYLTEGSRFMDLESGSEVVVPTEGGQAS